MEKTCRICVALLCSILVAGQQQEEKDPLVGLMLNKMKQNHQLTPEASSASEKKILEASRASTPAPTPPPPPPPPATRLKVGSQASRPSEQKQDSTPKREGLAGLMKNKIQEDQNAEALEKARKEQLEEEKRRAAKALETRRAAQAIEERRKAAQEIEERRQRAEASSRAVKEIEERQKLAAQETKQQANARAAIEIEERRKRAEAASSAANRGSQLVQSKQQANARAAAEIEERRKRAEAASRGAQLVQSKQQANARAASEIEERRKRAEATRVAQEVNSRREANARAAQEIEERRQRAEASRRAAQEAEDRQARAEANRRAAQEIEKRKRLAESSRQQQENERRAAILQQMKEEQDKQRRDQMIVQAKKLEQVKQQKRQASSYKPSPARQRIDAEYAQQPWGFGSKPKYANYGLQQQQRQSAAQPSYLKNRLNQAVQREQEPANDHDAMAESILDGFDTDGDGQISYYELMDHVGAENHKSPEFQGLLNADENGDMYITLEELAARLKNVDAEAKKVQKQNAGPNSQHVQIAASIMENLDANGDGKVSLQELVSNLKDEHHQHPDFKGWHAGFKEADADSDMHLTIGELAHLFKAMDDDEQEL